MLDILSKNHSNLIYADIDAIWLEDPTSYLVGDYDFWAQLDGVMHAKPYAKGFLPYFCTGFLAMKNTTSSLNILREWMKELEISKSKSNEKDTFVGSQMSLMESGI